MLKMIFALLTVVFGIATIGEHSSFLGHIFTFMLCILCGILYSRLEGGPENDQ